MIRKTVVLLTFLVMIAMNALANIVPINGVNTGQVSDSYPDLFAPIGFTFAIWGLIYVLLGAYTFFQLTDSRQKNYKKVSWLFAFTSIINALWIVAWHYFAIGMSLVLMLILLVSLSAITLDLHKKPMSRKEYLLVKMPFSIYFGWITVATIANVTAFLVDSGFTNFLLSEEEWLMVVLGVGLLITLRVVTLLRDKFYALVVLWAYVGILAKHLSPTGFAGTYQYAIAVVVVCIVLLMAIETSVIMGKGI